MFAAPRLAICQNTILGLCATGFASVPRWEKGQDALRELLEETTVGRIAPAATTGTDLSIARLHATEDGKIIRLVTARPVSFFEAYRGGRSMDYPFTIMELRLDKDWKGEGSMEKTMSISI